MKKLKNNAVGPQVRETKAASKRLLPIALVCASMLCGLTAGTQMFAHLFQYQPVLGYNINGVYAPWSILQWASRWSVDYPDQFVKAGSAGAVIAALGLLITGVIMTVLRNTGSAHDYLHGSARWADEDDIRAAGLLPDLKSTKEAPPSVYVGGWVDKKGKLHHLRHSGPEHVLSMAPTRSGKGVGQVVPTLLSYTDSVLVTDIKSELWQMTSGWRQKYANNKVLRFEPAADNGGVCWNALDEIRIGTEYEVGDVQNLAMVIVDPDGKGLENHWQKTAYALLVGVILHACYKYRAEGTHATLPLVDRMLADPDRDIRELWMEMKTYEHTESGTHLAVSSAAQDMLDRPDDEAGSVLSTAKSYLSLYRDPVVAKNVSRSDFSISDLMHHDNPVSCYLVTKPNDQARLRPLVRMFITMTVRILADGLKFEGGRPKATYKNRLLMMLDEFPALGKLEILQDSLAFLAGYGIKCFLIAQDINQLRSRERGYGHDETVTSNCHVQAAYPPNRQETAEHLSRLTGQTTVVKENITTSGKRASTFLGSVSHSYSEVQRPLLTPDECQRMPAPKKRANGEIISPGDMVIYIAGSPMIYGQQLLYFKIPAFVERAAIPAPEASDVIRKSHVVQVSL